mmetsp:Transcript_130482/g.377441  ORF Transcript_130482/g.377441 Transcript_130482/m.377441 type:complete len:209 (+) Transcript_130482:149-775(+)
MPWYTSAAPLEVRSALPPNVGQRERASVHELGAEEFVVKALAGGGAPALLHGEQMADEVRERSVLRLDGVLRQRALGAHVAHRLHGGAALGPSQAAPSPDGVLKVLFSHVPGHAAEHRLGQRAQDLLHEREVFYVALRTEEQLPGVQLHDDAPHRPYIGRLVPPQVQDGLGRAILPGADDLGVVLVLIRGVSEVDQLDRRRRWAQVRS